LKKSTKSTAKEIKEKKNKAINDKKVKNAFRFDK